eukprot:8512989-Pyramimonas_sp.AAC.1
MGWNRPSEVRIPGCQQSPTTQHGQLGGPEGVGLSRNDAEVDALLRQDSKHETCRGHLPRLDCEPMSRPNLHSTGPILTCSSEHHGAQRAFFAD